MRRTPLLVFCAALLLTAGSAAAVDFNDRDLLFDLLTLDEQAPLADAEEALAEAESDLADAQADLQSAGDQLDAANMTLADVQAAQTAVDAAAAASAQAEIDAQTAVDDAQAALDQALQDMLPPADIALLEQILANTEAALVTAAAQAAADAGAAEAAAMAVADAEAAASAAQLALEDAQDAVDTAQMAFDEADAVVQAILGEIEGTETFVADLDDRQVFALNRSLHPAVQTGLVPLDIPLDLLQRIIDEDLGDGEIQALTRGFRFEAFFDGKSAWFADRGKQAQAERFADKADEMLARNLARVDGPPGQAKKAANAAANAANDAANAAANDAVQDIAQDEVKGQGKGLARAPGQN